jgi:hypothetical protein
MTKKEGKMGRLKCLSESTLDPNAGLDLKLTAKQGLDPKK